MGWNTQVVIAQLVIIEGPNDGLFVYAGTPALGNLIVSAAAQAGTDQFGNAYPEGINVTQGVISGTTISSSVLEGPDYVLNSAGAFFYSAAPALGNLIGSITNTGGTDAEGNAYIASPPSGGYVVYGLIGGLYHAIAYGAGGVEVFSSTTPGGPYTDNGAAFQLTPAGDITFNGLPVNITVGAAVTGGLTTDTLSAGGGAFSVAGSGKANITAGGVNPLLVVDDTSATPGNPNIEVINLNAGERALGCRVSGDTVDRILLRSDGSLNWGPGGAAATDTTLARQAAGILQANGALALENSSAPGGLSGNGELYAASGVLHAVTASDFDGGITAGQTDTTQHTVTGTGSTLLGGSFTIPANDADVGTIYRYRTGGTATWGSTQQQLTLIESLASTNINQINVAAAAFAASTPVDWDLYMEIFVTATGSAGTCRARMVLAMSVNNASANTSNAVTAVRRAVSVAINTTVSRTFQLNALWASATGAPTITGDGAEFERVGP